MIVAFDFDDTLDDVRLQRLAAKMIKEKNDVWIVTARRNNEYSRNILKPVIDRLGLNFNRVVFCDEKPKVDYLKRIAADIYIDNITVEFQSLINNTRTIPLLWGTK